MNMPCRITDETMYNPWEDDHIEQETTLHDLSIYDLMADDASVWVGRNQQFGYVMEIEMDNGITIIEKQIHPCAMESMASFCRQFLKHYERIED